MFKKQNKYGFTVIEMLIVLSIIGSVVMIALPQMIRARFKADMTSCLAYEKRIAQSLEVRKNSQGSYPENLQILIQENLLTTKVPTCPSNGLSYSETYEVSDSFDRYTISCPGIHYKLLNVKQGFPQYSSAQGLQLGE